VNPDRCVRDTLETFATAFPNRIRACYMDGSHVDRTSLHTSDLDLTIVFGDWFEDEKERARAEELARRCAGSSEVALDSDVIAESDLSHGVPPMLKLASRLLYGDDVLADLPLLEIEEWTQDRMHAAYWLVVNVFHRPPVVRLSLGYPDPDGEFFGYDNRSVRGADGVEFPSTRNLVRVTGWMATALVAFVAREYVPSKRRCHELYRLHVGDGWSSLLEEFYTVCRGRWSYLIPPEPSDQEQLRASCARTLAFENHFMMRYRDFLLPELRSGVDQALWLQGRVPFDDAEVYVALVALASTTDEPLRTKAR